MIQGRLSPPIEGFQECPRDWQEEFETLQKIGLDHIEWVITENKYDANPVLHECLQGFPISSICADFLIAENFFSDVVIAQRLSRVCEVALSNGIRHITLPLLEGSDVSVAGVRHHAIEFLRDLVNEFPQIDFLIEAELGIEETGEILSMVPAINLVYDTGNMTTVGVDHTEFIRVHGSRIQHVHLKDRIAGKDGNPITVHPGRGVTPFRLIFRELKAQREISENKNLVFTIQTARGESGKEVERIQLDKQFFEENYYAEHL